MNDRYKAGIRLHGVLYLHRITDMKIGGVSKRTLHVFRKFCGGGSLRNVIVVTNMWDKVAPEEGDAREELLHNDPRFKPLLDAEATMLRHNNTRQSAHQLIRRICSHPPSALDIQTETVRDGKPLHETSAGIALFTQLRDFAQGLQEAKDRTWQELRKAIAEENKIGRRDLMIQLRQHVPVLARILNEMKNLEMLVREDIDVVQEWNRMDKRVRLVTLLRRCNGKDDTREKTVFWVAMGDTTKVVKRIYTEIFRKYPLPADVEDQLLDIDASALNKVDSEALNSWFATNGKVVKEMEGMMQKKVDARAKAMAHAIGGRKKYSLLGLFGFAK